MLMSRILELSWEISILERTSLNLDRENINLSALLRMELNMKENGLWVKTSVKAKECKYGPMVLFTKAGGLRTKLTERED